MSPRFHPSLTLPLKGREMGKGREKLKEATPHPHPVSSTGQALASPLKGEEVKEGAPWKWRQQGSNWIGDEIAVTDLSVFSRHKDKQDEINNYEPDKNILFDGQIHSDLARLLSDQNDQFNRQQDYRSDDVEISQGIGYAIHKFDYSLIKNKLDHHKPKDNNSPIKSMNQVAVRATIGSISTVAKTTCATSLQISERVLNLSLLNCIQNQHNTDFGFVKWDKVIAIKFAGYGRGDTVFARARGFTPP